MVRLKGMATSSVLLLLMGTCLTTGCAPGAKRLAMFSNPSSKVSYHWFWGLYAETGSDFEGTLKASYDPETKQLVIDLTISSDPTPVIGAEGTRADHLVELHRLDVERHRLVGENFKAFGTMVALASVGGGEAVAKVIDAAAPILKGSGLGFDIAGIGSVSANLGAAEPDEPKVPEPPPE